MAAKKYYAVLKGMKTGIFETWDACKESVDGYPGAQYKSFKTLDEARVYLGEEVEVTTVVKNSKAPLGNEKREDALVAYVDGSYEHSVQTYGFGCVFLLPDGSIYTENGGGQNPESAALRNVTGEMLGAMFAVQFAMKNGFSKIEIRYDYEGIEKWVTGAWKSKTDLTIKYAERMRQWAQVVAIEFTKVPAHEGVFFNELADELAKDAVATAKPIPAAHVKEEMTPWKQD